MDAPNPSAASSVPMKLRPQLPARARRPAVRRALAKPAARPRMGAWLLALMAAVLLHYLLTPAESVGETMAMQIRLAMVIALATTVTAATFSRSLEQGYLGVMMGICIWILLLNYPPATWYALVFPGFVACSMLVARGFVVENTRLVASRALDILLLAWTGAFMVQFVIYYATGAVVDFHQMTHPFSAARLIDIPDQNIMRLSGAHIEPGTHSNWVYGLVVLRILVRRVPFDFLGLVCVSCMVATLSFWGIMAAGLYLTVAIAHSMSGMSLKSAVKGLAVLSIAGALVAALGVIGIDNISDYLHDRSAMDDGSGYEKIEAYASFLEALPKVIVAGFPVDVNYCSTCESPQDVGILLNLTVYLGLLGALATFAVIARALWRIGGPMLTLLLLPLAIAKYFYYEPLLWLIFGVALLDWIRETPAAGRRMRVIRTESQERDATKAMVAKRKGR